MFEQKKKTIIVIIAPSCTGKSTFIKYFKQSDNFFVKFNNYLDLDIDKTQLVSSGYIKWIRGHFKESNYTLLHFDLTSRTSCDINKLINLSLKNNIKLVLVALYTNRKTYIKRLKKRAYIEGCWSMEAYSKWITGQERLIELKETWNKYFNTIEDKKYAYISKIIVYNHQNYNYNIQDFDKNIILSTLFHNI